MVISGGGNIKSHRNEDDGCMVLLVKTRRSAVQEDGKVGDGTADFSRDYVDGTLNMDRSRMPNLGTNEGLAGNNEEPNEIYQTGKYSIVEILEDDNPLRAEEQAIISRHTKLPGINKSRKSGMFSQTGKSSGE